MDDSESLDYQQVRAAFQELMQEVELSSESRVCPPEVLWDILGLAAVTSSTIHGTTSTLAAAPTSATVLRQLREGWLAQRSLPEVEAQLNALVVQQLPRGIRGNTHELALDIVAVPYHGQPHVAEEEIRRSLARAGTSHFHMYATAYVIRRHKRVTVALAYWRADETLVALLQRLLTRLRALCITPKRLLLDRQFCTVAVLRYLEAHPFQSLLPVPARGRQLQQLQQQARRSHTTRYTMRSAADGSVTFALHVVCRYRNGRRQQHGIERLLFAVLGRPWRGTPYRLRHKYRTRFGIESTYRQMNRLRARTASRDPKLRLLLVALAFVLLNLWRTLCWSYLTVPRRGGRYLDDSRFRLHTFVAFLVDAIHEVRPPRRRIPRPLGIP